MFAHAETWVAIGFLIVLALALWFAGKSMLATLDGRAERIKAALDEAQALREEAQRELAEVQRRQRDAVAEAEEIVARAKEQAKRQSADAAAKTKTALQRREQQALDRIAQIEEQTVSEVRGMAIDVALSATGELLREHMEGAEADPLVDETIKSLSKRLN